MRTTLDLDPSVASELRRRGAAEGKTMGAVASELLAKAFVSAPAEIPPLRWVSKSLGVPKVDLEDKEAVQAVLDGR